MFAATPRAPPPRSRESNPESHSKPEVRVGVRESELQQDARRLRGRGRSAIAWPKRAAQPGPRLRSSEGQGDPAIRCPLARGAGGSAESALVRPELLGAVGPSLCVGTAGLWWRKDAGGSPWSLATWLLEHKEGQIKALSFIHLLSDSTNASVMVLSCYVLGC
jgi:hypothetical protein